MDKSPVTPCPDAETLAAWLDHGLEERERTVVTAHVAACDDCRGIAANVLKFQDAERVQEAGPGAAPLPFLNAPAAAASTVPPVRVVKLGRKITWGGSVLAAAAALFLAVNLQPGLMTRWWANGAETRLADLAQATSGQRTVEGRLTGGFEYGPLRAPVRSGGSTAAPKDNWALLAAAAKISEEAEKSPVAANLHGLGIAALVLGEHDEAISALEDATSEEPESGRYQSDLAAAYLARAQAADRPDDLTRGLTAAERALKANDHMLEARFNRALALERLYLTDQARKAWQEYLEHDPASPWSEEARQHLQALPEPAATEGQARNNSPPEVRPNNVEAALDWLLLKGLPGWANSDRIDGPSDSPSDPAFLRNYAASISTLSGDPFAHAAAATLGGAEQARSLRDFGRMLSALAADDLAGAEKLMPSTCPALAEPLRTLCDIERGVSAAIRRDAAAAQTYASTALARAEAGNYQYLKGRALRLDAFRLAYAGQSQAAIERYRQTYAAFEVGKYLVQAGIVASHTADLLNFVGLAPEAWKWRHNALRMSALTQAKQLQYTTRVSIADFVAGLGLPEAERVFATAIGDADPTSLPPLMQAVRELRLVRASLALDAVPEARQSIDRASRLLSDSADYRASRMRADELWLRARVAAVEARTEDAQATLTEALEMMGAERAVQRAAALLMRARLRVQHGELPSATRDVSNALNLLSERSDGGTLPLRLDDAPAAFEAIAALIGADPTLQSLRGLHLVEQLRETLDGVPVQRRFASAESLGQALSGLQPEQAIVVFVFSGDGRLLAWTLRPGAIQFSVLPTSARDIATLVNLLTVQIAHAGAQERVWRPTLTQLHDALLAPLAPDTGGATELIVVPDGVLNRVPFASLIERTGGAFLFERLSVRAAPNLAFALAPPVSGNSRPAAARQALIVGEPALEGPGARFFARLPRAKAEASAVANLYHASTLLTGRQATKAAVLRNLETPDVLHFAGHALFTPQGGYAPRLLLAGPADDPDSSLRPADLVVRRSGAPLRVVLAACETGATQVDRASGVSSLAAAFLRAGAVSVAATLWPVNDFASEEFFLTLHQGLMAGDTMPQAVGRAQRACRASESCRKDAAIWIGTSAFGSS